MQMFGKRILRGSMAKKRFDELKVGHHYRETYIADGKKETAYVKLVHKVNDHVFDAGAYRLGHKVTPYHQYYWIADDPGHEYDDTVPVGYKKKLDDYEKECRINVGDVLCDLRRERFFKVISRTKTQATLQEVGVFVTKKLKTGMISSVEPSTIPVGAPKSYDVYKRGFKESIRIGDGVYYHQERMSGIFYPREDHMNIIGVKDTEFTEEGSKNAPPSTKKRADRCDPDDWRWKRVRVQKDHIKTVEVKP